MTNIPPSGRYARVLVNGDLLTSVLRAFTPRHSGFLLQVGDHPLPEDVRAVMAEVAGNAIAVLVTSEAFDLCTPDTAPLLPPTELLIVEHDCIADWSAELSTMSGM